MREQKNSTLISKIFPDFLSVEYSTYYPEIEIPSFILPFLQIGCLIAYNTKMSF